MNRSLMHKDISRFVIWNDETESLFRIKPLDLSTLLGEATHNVHSVHVERVDGVEAARHPQGCLGEG